MSDWKIRITGEQKSDLNIDLLLAAVLALGYQMQDEAQAQQARDTEETSQQTPGDQTSESAGDAPTSSTQEAPGC